jgi:TRAP-type uncharacterized transport system substrate-binding protein
VAGVKEIIFRSLPVIAGMIFSSAVFPQDTLQNRATGFDVRKPVMAAACVEGCPWGEIGDFVKESMKLAGYDVQLCRNCGQMLGPGLVSRSLMPPSLREEHLAAGMVSPGGRIDFGVTASDFLIRAYHGIFEYRSEGPYKNLRLIAKIEDPFYVAIAAREETGITDLSQIREKRLAVRVACMDSPITQVILAYYGITQKDLESWGGSMGNIMEEKDDALFDVIISDLATPANNPESDYWTYFTYNYKLVFISLPEDLINEVVRQIPGTEKVIARWGLLRGIKAPFLTIGRSGESVFARDDMPVQAAYDMARAIDMNRQNLKWFIRPYSYDPRTVWENGDVPLHPGAERYYRDMGYINE